MVTTAWTVREDAAGTVTIDLRQSADPAGLQRTLRADGINAIVRQVPSASRTFRDAIMTYPLCDYATTNEAPQAVQRAVVAFASQYLPARYVIQPDAMPPGSALFLAIMTGAGRTQGNGTTGGLTFRPVVLNNDTVPACVPRRPFRP